MDGDTVNAATPATEPDFRAILAIAAVGALASLMVTGCLVGVRNDLYFLPILGALYDLPQFANDTFIQSLRHYASGPWMLLSGLANYVPVSALSLVLGFFSRWLAFVGFGLCASLLGAHARKEQVLLAFLLCSFEFHFIFRFQLFRCWASTPCKFSLRHCIALGQWTYVFVAQVLRTLLSC